MPFVAAVYRVPFVTMTVISPGEIADIVRWRVPSDDAARARVRKLLKDYRCRSLVTEPESRLLSLGDELGLDIVRLSLRDAKRWLLPSGSERTHIALYAHLLDRYPSLSRFTNVSGTTGKFDLFARWRNEKLLSCALGLGAFYGAGVLKRAQPREPIREFETIIQPPRIDISEMLPTEPDERFETEHDIAPLPA